MRLSLVLSLLFILGAAFNANGQAILVPRRHKIDTPQSSPAQSSGASVAADGTKQSGKPADEVAGSTEQVKPVSPLPAALPVSAININIHISGQVATVTVAHVFANDTDDLLEGTYYFPVPQGASLEEFAVYDGDQRRVGRVKEKEQARADYAAAVAHGEDPAILEMTKSGWFQSHVYPIPPHAGKRVEIIYSQVLGAKEGAVTFDYPLGQGYKKLKVPVGNVSIELDLKAPSPINNVFSPTHPLDVSYDGDRHATAAVKTVGGANAENFRLQYSLSDADVGLSLITYRKQGQDGYFLLMLSPRVELDHRKISSKDVLFVIDVSGSMQGSKIAQAREALLFGLAHTLSENDRFNIISFNSAVSAMEPGLIQATGPNIERALQLVSRFKADGGTDINDALITAMKMFEPGARPKNLVFLTDGVPENGVTDPNQIAANVRSANGGRVRLFAFGVGSDVNRVLLERLAADNRGAGSNIDNEAQLGSTMSSFFSKVSQPVLANLQVDFGPVQVDRVHPAELPDLYTRSQIRIMGRYRNPEDLKNVTVTLTGQMSEQPQQFQFNGLDFPLVTEDSASLPKLWATERVGALLSQIRLYGERPDLKQEIIDLANEFNLVTPYTSMYVPTSAELDREPKNPQQQAVSALPTGIPGPPSAGPGSGAGMGSGSGSGNGSGSGTGAGPGHGYNMGGGGPQIGGGNRASSLPINGRTFNQATLSPAQNPPPPGTVVDQTGAAIVNATVTITDKNTGATRTVTTDAAGNYSVAGLQPGTYDVEVDAPGFKKTEVQGVAVQPGQVAAAGVQLSVASTTETVTVMAANSQVVDTASTAVSSNYESKTVQALPNRQSVTTLALLAPGVVAQRQFGNGEGKPAPEPDRDLGFSVAGGRFHGVNYTLDGQDNNDVNGRPAVSPRNPNTVQALQVLGAAGFGDASGTGSSSINVVTRSGSNSFHGGVFGFDLDRRWGAMSALERRSGLGTAPAASNTLLGFNLGGPIRRDRLFFFGSFEADTARTNIFADSTGSSITPTTLGLAELSRSFPRSPAVSDLINRRIATDPLGTTNFFRTLVIPVLGVPVQFGEITRIVPSTASGYQGNARVDLNLTPRDSLRAAYWFQSRSATSAVGRLAAGYPDQLRDQSQLGGLHWSRSISPRAVNEFSVGFNRSSAALGEVQDANLPASPSVAVGLHGLSFGASPLLPQSHLSTLFELEDTFTLTRGRHNITVGGQLKRRITHLSFLSQPVEQINYQDFNAFVLAQPLTVTVAEGNPGYPFSETQQYYFADDRWRPRDDLTLSFGLGYQNSGQPLDGLAARVARRESGTSPLFDPSMPLALRTITMPRRDNDELSPRFALAYTPRIASGIGRKVLGIDKTVIRGGASISFDATGYQALADIQAGAPNTLMAVLLPAYAAQLARSGAMPGVRELQRLIGLDPRAYAGAQLSPGFHTPYSITWHLSTGRSFDDRINIEAAYVGARGNSLARAVDGSPTLAPVATSASAPASGSPASGLPAGPLRLYESSGHSIYHGLQSRAEFRFANKLTAGVSYTFSKMIDDIPDSMVSGASIGTIGALSGPAFPGLAQDPFDSSRGERALASMDRRHNLMANFIWSIPVRKSPDSISGKLLAGWQASGIVRFQSGQPFTAVQQMGYSAASSAIFASSFSDLFGSVRPFAGNPLAAIDTVAFSNAANSFYHFFANLNGTPYLSPTGFIVGDSRGFHAGSPGDARFIYNDFAVEQAAIAMGLAPDAFGKTFANGRPFGDVGRNTLTGPSLANVDFAMLKNIKFNERVTLQLRAELYNILNHPNRGLPNSILENAGGFGFMNVGDTDATPRQIRFGAKLTF